MCIPPCCRWLGWRCSGPAIADVNRELFWLTKRVRGYTSPKGVYAAFGWRLEQGWGVFWEQKLGIRGCQRLKSRAQACRSQTVSVWSAAVSKGHLSGSCCSGWRWKSPVESQTSCPGSARSSGWGWPRKTARQSVIFTFFFSSCIPSVYVLIFHIECCSCHTTVLSSRWRFLLCWSWMLLNFCAFPSFLWFFTCKAHTCMVIWV